MLSADSCFARTQISQLCIVSRYSGLTEDSLISFLSAYATPPPTPGPSAYSFSSLGAGLLAYVLERALETPWEQLLHDVVTGPDAADMPDTVCMLGAEQVQRVVPGYMHEWDYTRMVRSVLRELLSSPLFVPSTQLVEINSEGETARS